MQSRDRRVDRGQDDAVQRRLKCWHGHKAAPRGRINYWTLVKAKPCRTEPSDGSPVSAVFGPLCCRTARMTSSPQSTNAREPWRTHTWRRGAAGQVANVVMQVIPAP